MLKSFRDTLQIVIWLGQARFLHTWKRKNVSHGELFTRVSGRVKNFSTNLLKVCLLGLQGQKVYLRLFSIWAQNRANYAGKC